MRIFRNLRLIAIALFVLTVIGMAGFHYDARATSRSWALMLDRLEETLAPLGGRDDLLQSTGSALASFTRVITTPVMTSRTPGSCVSFW